MTNHMVTFSCDVCGEDQFVPPELECCGVKYCFPCNLRTMGECHVCKKDELNQPIQCDMCGRMGNAFTVQVCSKPTPPVCEMWVCDECNKAGPTLDGLPPPFKYCSHKHFQAMLIDLWERHGE